MTKLTVHIPDELHRRLKVVVAQEGTTMTSVVREGLEAYLARLEEMEEADDAQVVQERMDRLTRGEEAWVDWEDVKAEWDAAQG